MNVSLCILPATWHTVQLFILTKLHWTNIFNYNYRSCCHGNKHIDDNSRSHYDRRWPDQDFSLFWIAKLSTPFISQTCLTGDSTVPVNNPTHSFQSPLPPPPPPRSGGATTIVSQLATSELSAGSLTHPAGKGKWCMLILLLYDTLLFVHSMADIIEVMRHQVDAKWKHFGTFLRFDPALMDTIEQDNRGSTDCMLDLVTKWVTHHEGTGDLPRTWQTVDKAIRLTGGLGNLQRGIELP